MVYTLRFFSSSKCSLFHNSNVFGSCFIHILYTGSAKIKKIYNSGAKTLRHRAVLGVSINFFNNISHPSLEKWLTLTDDEEQKCAMRTTNCSPKGSMDVFESHFVKSKNTSINKPKTPFACLMSVCFSQYPIQLIRNQARFPQCKLLISTDVSAYTLYTNLEVPKRSYQNVFQIIRGNLL